jgi:hypothetical protein
VHGTDPSQASKSDAAHNTARIDNHSPAIGERAQSSSAATRRFGSGGARGVRRRTVPVTRAAYVDIAEDGQHARALIVLEEAHHILARRAVETKESVLETSIRMIRQYGIGYVFVDQSASLLSKVAFANSYATLALSQKLRSDIQTMSGAMNLTDEQRDALSTLSIGTAVVRLADEHPEAFLVKVPRCPIREGSVCDQVVRERMGTYYTESASNSESRPEPAAIPVSDKNNKNNRESVKPHPPSPSEQSEIVDEVTPTPIIHNRSLSQEPSPRPSPWEEEGVHRIGSKPPPPEPISREAMRFLTDVAARPLSTTVSRYQRLHLSRRRGNAIRQDLVGAGIIEAVPIATRSGQVMLHEFTDQGLALCDSLGIDPGPPPRASLEHTFWAHRIARDFEEKGYKVALEQPIDGDGIVDVVASRPGERVAIEIETGKSDIKMNLEKLRGLGFDRIVLVATSPSAVTACQRALQALADCRAELMTWLEVS